MDYKTLAVPSKFTPSSRKSAFDSTVSQEEKYNRITQPMTALALSDNIKHFVLSYYMHCIHCSPDKELAKLPRRSLQSSWLSWRWSLVFPVDEKISGLLSFLHRRGGGSITTSWRKERREITICKNHLNMFQKTDKCWDTNDLSLWMVLMPASSYYRSYRQAAINCQLCKLSRIATESSMRPYSPIRDSLALS